MLKLIKNLFYKEVIKIIYGAILAGGIGSRIKNSSVPKQFIPIGDIPVIEHTLRTFLANSRFDKIYVAVHKDWKDYLIKLVNKKFFHKETAKLSIVDGGTERLDSFINILNALMHEKNITDKDVLICHDAVRPFVSQRIINDCIDSSLKYNFALTVIPTSDTIHTSFDGDFITGALDRKGLYNGQTPSGFNVKLLKNAIDNFSDNRQNALSSTTRLMLEAGYKIKLVNGDTENFKITTDNDLDIANLALRARPKTRKIELLDCTLRDGGIVIDFQFSYERMQSIKTVLENSGVEYIECGYINENAKGVGTRFDSELAIERSLLSTGKKHGVVYLAMIDYGTFDVRNLHDRSPVGIDGIRLAFHKENMRESIEWGKIILDKGYDLYIQPMIAPRYSNEEYKVLISACNSELNMAKAFYIVDSFGQLNHLELFDRFTLVDKYIVPHMKIGFHAHNNRQLAYSNSLAFVNFSSAHDLILDSSIMGMGKGPGNLCTELIEPILSLQERKSYKTVVIYEIINEYFAAQQKITPWGYDLNYYLSSLYSCTPSYVKFFTHDKRVTIDILIKLLRDMPASKKAAYDKKFACEYLDKFFQGANI